MTYAYPWRQTPDGLLVLGVELMGLIDPAERPDFGLPAPGVDAEWMQRAAKTAELMRDKGKFPRLLRQHNQPERAAEVVGKVLNVRWQAPWLVGDLLITNPDAAGKAARGEFPSRSAEFRFESAYLHGLALIEGAEGHFDEELPDLSLQDQAGLEELRQLGLPETGRARRCHTALPLRLQADWAAEREEIFRRLAALEAAVKPFFANQQAAAGPHALAAENELLRTEIWLRDAIEHLQALGSPLSRDQIRRQLLEPQTAEGRRERLARLCELPKAPGDGLPADEPETPARRQFQRLVAQAARQGVALPFTEQDYLKAIEMETRS